MMTHYLLLVLLLLLNMIPHLISRLHRSRPSPHRVHDVVTFRLNAHEPYPVACLEAAVHHRLSLLLVLVLLVTSSRSSFYELALQCCFCFFQCSYSCFWFCFFELALQCSSLLLPMLVLVLLLLLLLRAQRCSARASSRSCCSTTGFFVSVEISRRGANGRLGFTVWVVAPSPAAGPAAGPPIAFRTAFCDFVSCDAIMFSFY